MESLLITGASGFVGRHIYDFFKHEYQIATLGLMPIDDIICDLSKQIPIMDNGFENVIHLAGKAHSLPKTEKEKQVFFDVNYSGLKNLLTALTNTGKLPKRFVLFSSVAVYGLESGTLINENTPHFATDPYGQSKAMAEKVLCEWGMQHHVAVTIVRPPLIVGKDAPGNLGDMVNAIKIRRYFNINHGKTRRSMVMADDIAPFIPLVWNQGGSYHLTDGYHPSFGELSAAISINSGMGRVINLPYYLVYMAALAFDLLAKIVRKPMPISVYKLRKLMNSYTFDDALARSKGYKSKSVVACANQWV